MVLGIIRRRGQGSQKRAGPVHRVLRIIVDGRELLVRRLIRITPEEIVYVDFSGHVRVMRREKRGAKKHVIPITL